MVGAFPELNKDLNERITTTLCLLYLKGYNQNSILSKHIIENELQKYISFTNIIKYTNKVKLVESFVQIFIHRLYPIKTNFSIHK